MAVHPKPLGSKMDSPAALCWIEAVQDQMLKDQALEASAFNRWMLQTTTFTPVKIYVALLYAEVEYLQKQRERYPLDQIDALEAIFQNETEFIHTSSAFRHGMLHPQAGNDQFETEWLERGFQNRLPEIQRTVDSITLEAKARVRSDIQAVLVDLSDLQRWICLARFTSSLVGDDAVLLDNAQYDHLLESINQLDEELPKIRFRNESLELCPGQLRIVERVLHCMANLHDWGVPAHDESVFGDIQPKMRPRFFQRAEFIDDSPCGLTSLNRHTNAVARNLAGYNRIIDAAGILLNESRSAVPGLDEAIERGEPTGEIVQLVHNSPLYVRHSVVGLGIVAEALLYSVVQAYQSVCRENPSLQNGLVLSAVADPRKLRAMRSLRNTVFHVAFPESDPYEIGDLASEGDPDHLRNLFAGLSAFVGSMSRYTP